ncbi:hypothetical protein CW752_01805 [Chryseobacterium sp. PMSZPI]|nr:hypothetical protein CW752_01805 [Chryseobacterium sp. PMSZPI]
MLFPTEKTQFTPNIYSYEEIASIHHSLLQTYMMSRQHFICEIREICGEIFQQNLNLSIIRAKNFFLKKLWNNFTKNFC